MQPFVKTPPPVTSRGRHSCFSALSVVQVSDVTDASRHCVSSRHRTRLGSQHFLNRPSACIRIHSWPKTPLQATTEPQNSRPTSRPVQIIFKSISIVHNNLQKTTPENA